jgi:glutaminyl-tRNA synthetase
LNLEGTVMSKRKILALVKEGYVSGWDDPRLYTLIALRRRGIPPGAILSFVSTLGVSTSPTNIEIQRFDQSIRQYLETTAPRLLMVLRPLKVILENVPEDYEVMIEKALHPKDPALGSSTIPFTRTLYIDRDDFRLEDSKDYFRLAPGKTVGLFQAPHPITCVSYKMSESGEVTELVCRLENEGNAPKPKAFIQWVAEHKALASPIVIDETRVFHRLFKSDQPPSDFRSDINPGSLEIVKGGLIEVGFWSLAKRSMAEAKAESKKRMEVATTAKAVAPVSASHDTPYATAEQLIGNEVVRFQGLRVAYFALDKDAHLQCLDGLANVRPTRGPNDYLVLNRIVSLKEDAAKGA